MPGILDGVMNMGTAKTIQKPDGTYVVVDITAEDFKREILNSADPKYRPYINVVPTGNGFRIEIKLV